MTLVEPSGTVDDPLECADDDVLMSLSAIVKSFGAVRAVQGVSLILPRGRITALVGDNGAGKSTLVKIMSGVLHADSGEIHFQGLKAHIATPQDASALGIETVYQELALADNLDAVCNLYMGRELTYGPPGLRFLLAHRRMAREGAALFHGLGLRLPSLRTRVRYLSGGQRQAVALCRATAWGSRLIIMDEPTAALGVQESGKVLEIVKTLPARGITVLMISHNIQHVFAVCDDVAVLRHGKLVAHAHIAETSPEEVVAWITGALVVTSVAEYEDTRSRRGASGGD